TFAYNQAANTAGDTLSITNTATGKAEPITIAANASVDDVVGAINGDTNAGVFAVDVNGSVVLASTTTGNAGAFTASRATVTEDHDAMTLIRNDVAEKPVSTDPSKGSLYGDFTMSSLEDTLRGTFGQMFSNIGNPASMQLLSQAGISTGTTTGSGTFSQDAV